MKIMTYNKVNYEAITHEYRNNDSYPKKIQLVNQYIEPGDSLIRIRTGDLLT